MGGTLTNPCGEAEFAIVATDDSDGTGVAWIGGSTGIGISGQELGSPGVVKVVIELVEGSTGVVTDANSFELLNKTRSFPELSSRGPNSEVTF